MGPRPVHLGLDRDGNDHVPPRTDWHLDLPSPRIGEVPPALSPLDAFAMQSRLLAKRFEQEQQNGRRISRLPPVMVQQGLLSRPDYFRKISGGSETTMDTPLDVRQDTSPTSPKGLAVTGGPDNERPVSHYPRLGHASRPSRTDLQPTSYYDAEERPVRDYFGVSAPRASSPEPVDPRLNVEAPSPLLPSLTSSMDSVQSSQPRTFTDGSTHSQRSLRSERGLYPPKSPNIQDHSAAYRAFDQCHRIAATKKAMRTTVPMPHPRLATFPAAATCHDHSRRSGPIPHLSVDHRLWHQSSHPLAHSRPRRSYLGNGRSTSLGH